MATQLKISLLQGQADGTQQGLLIDWFDDVVKGAESQGFGGGADIGKTGDDDEGAVDIVLPGIFQQIYPGRLF